LILKPEFVILAFDMRENFSPWTGLILGFFLVCVGGGTFFLNYRFFHKIPDAMQYGLGYPILVSGLVLLFTWLGLWYISSEEKNEKNSD